jgi:membrane protease YdiL (CAAX protease family)
VADALGLERRTPVTARPAELREEDRTWSAAEVTVAAIAFVLASLAVATRTERASSGNALVAAGVFFTIVAGGYIAFSVSGVRHGVRSALDGRGAAARLLIGPALLLTATIAYAAAAGLPVASRLGSYAAYLLVPPLFLAGPGTEAVDDRQVRAREVALVLALWLPIEFRVLPPLPLPAPGGLDMRKLVGLVDAMYLFLIARPLSRVGYTYRLTTRDVAIAVGAFLLFAVVALPVGFATGFIGWHPRLDAAHIAGAPLIIYLVTGVPEEFLFRGLLQNLLTRRLGRGAGLGVASVIFGLAHLPDWRYALLATIAGLAYGWVYQRTQRITASAITHALVDGTWVVLLGG